MTISVIQAILIGLLYYLGINGTPWTTLLGSTILQKPLVSGVLVGCILGDPVQGAIIGAAIQLPFIAYISAGGAPPTDPGLAGTLGTALAMAAGVKPEAAIAMAVPIGLLGTIIWVLHMTIDVFFVHMIDKAADEGNMKKAEFLHIVPPQIVALLLGAIPVALGCYFGSGVVTKIITLLDGTPLRTLEVIGGILPAIGIAMNLRAISKPGILMWYILGFIIAVYLNLATMPIAIIAGIVVALIALAIVLAVFVFGVGQPSQEATDSPEQTSSQQEIVVELTDTYSTQFATDNSITYPTFSFKYPSSWSLTEELVTASGETVELTSSDGAVIQYEQRAQSTSSADSVSLEDME